METLYALILITAPIVDGKMGQDDSYVLDDNLSKRDCIMSAFERSDAAYTLFGADVMTTLSCKPAM